MTRLCAFAAALLLSLLPSGAFGVTKINKIIPANTTSYLYGMATYDRWSCRAGATPELGQWSAGYGTISAETVRQKVGKGKRCAGKTFTFLVIYYTPLPGYRGKDLVTFSILAQQDTGRSKRKIWAHRAYVSVK